MGYTLVPPNMMANFKHFPEWDAFDCAHKRGEGQGIIASRATKNANGRLVTVSVSDVLGTESRLTCEAIMGAEADCFKNSPSAVTRSSTEGGVPERLSPYVPHAEPSQCPPSRARRIRPHLMAITVAPQAKPTLPTCYSRWK